MSEKTVRIEARMTIDIDLLKKQIYELSSINFGHHSSVGEAMTGTLNLLGEILDQAEAEYCELEPTLKKKDNHE